MSNRKKAPEVRIPTPEAFTGNRNDCLDVSRLVSEMMKRTGLDREEIARRATRLTGSNIGKSTMDGWTSMGRLDRNMPFCVVPALSSVCNSYKLAEWLAEKLGGRFLFGKEVLLAELGKAELEAASMQRKLDEIKKLLFKGEQR
uniref:Uncharacterized protein n=1 Tax=Candidatus Kentrum sp. LFY TaxID=2126342 RepID=A0A450WT22_9GAMM|nr:MAG: hypothetical protein BECKLFY1418C_GA0070996_10696 [Candidatus Kentron sp. LFY]